MDSRPARKASTSRRERGPRMLRWNGYDVPQALRSLPAGRYLVEPVDEAPRLTVEQEAGIEQALASLRDGRGISARKVRDIINVILTP